MLDKRNSWIVVLIALVLLMIIGARLIDYTRASIPTKSPDSAGVDLTTVASTAPPALTTSPGTATPTSRTFEATPTQPNVLGLTSVIGGVPVPSVTQTVAPPQLPPILIVVELQTESPTPGGQIVWILNRSNDEMNLGCWALHSTTTGLTVMVEPDLRIPAGAAVMLIPQEAWLGVTDQVQLLDLSRRVIDQTPELRDDVFDDQLWFRNANGEWKFGRTQLDITVVQGHISTQTPSGC